MVDTAESLIRKTREMRGYREKKVSCEGGREWEIMNSERAGDKIDLVAQHYRRATQKNLIKSDLPNIEMETERGLKILRERGGRMNSEGSGDEIGLDIILRDGNGPRQAEFLDTRTCPVPSQVGAGRGLDRT